ncbi:MAG: ATP-binding protein [bacterium]
MKKNEIVRILSDWNFWEKDIETGINRDSYVNKLIEFLNTGLITVITGARRSGKSFIMRQVAKRLVSSGVNKNEILIINFEDPRFTQLDVEVLQRIYETYLEFLSPKGKPYIFLDEVQEVTGWEKWVRTTRELQKAKIVISGSNAKLLSRELSSLLTGMHLDMTVYPLSFREHLLFNNLQLKDKLEMINKQNEIKALLRKYIEFGSFPEVVLHQQKKDILLRYYEDVLNKDLIKRFNIRKKEAIKSLAKYYLTNISNLITFNSIEKYLNLSADTIEKFSTYFEDAYILFFLKRFSFKVKEQDKSPKKVYCIDTGLANMIGFRTSENSGRLLENITYLKLKEKIRETPELEIFYWKDQFHREVDFVLKEKLKTKQLIQVCSNVYDEKTKQREIKALIKAMEEFGLKEGLVITEDDEFEEKIEGKKIRFLPLWQWLLSEKGW